MRVFRYSFVLGLFLLLSGCASSGSSYYGSPSFVWPVQYGKLTQGYKRYGKRHDGIDIAANKGTSIHASAGGRVLYAGRDFSGYGKLIIIEHAGDTWASFYGHLNSFDVREGQRVRQGQIIGKMGRTGRATGVHLHFEIRHNLQPVDPLGLLSQEPLLSRR